MPTDPLQLEAGINKLYHSVLHSLYHDPRPLVETTPLAPISQPHVWPEQRGHSVLYFI